MPVLIPVLPPAETAGGLNKTSGMRAKGAYDTLNPMTISSWQSELKQAIRDPRTLVDSTGLAHSHAALLSRATATFPVRVPAAFLDRIQHDDPDDPLLRQVLPAAAEDDETAGFSEDPLGESRYQPVPGLLAKYPGRVLLVATGVCAIHCRYCFRRHFPYQENNAGRNDWRPALAAIRDDISIHEVILSGGDPLSLSDAKLAFLLRELAAIAHVRRIRIHTRMPVVLPNRVTETLVDTLTEIRPRVVIVIHANHANEIDGNVAAAMTRLHDAGLALLNQSVLLRGVNDDAAALVDLSERLFDCHVLPYYLHMLDPVAGAAHFLVDDDRARRIMDELRTRLPGYLVPKLVREEEGELSKTPLGE